MLALKVHVLSLEPGDESGDSFVKAAVATDLDAGGDSAGKGINPVASDQVSAEGADAEERCGHGVWCGGVDRGRSR